MTNKDRRFYLGDHFIKLCGYDSILKFYFYDYKTSTQIYKLYFVIWKLKGNYNIQKFKSIYMPFYTAGLSHFIKNEDRLF